MFCNTDLQWGNRQAVGDKIRWIPSVHDGRDTRQSLKNNYCCRERHTKWREEWRSTEWKAKVCVSTTCMRIDKTVDTQLRELWATPLQKEFAIRKWMDLGRVASIILTTFRKPTSLNKISDHKLAWIKLKFMWLIKKGQWK